jgi:hypothetical protein
MDLQSDDKDMIVMYQFGYELNGEKKQIDSKMVCLVMIKPYCNGKTVVYLCNSCFTNIEWKN